MGRMNDIDPAAFRKLDAAGQIKALRGLKIERTFQVDRAAGIDKDKRTAWLSIASDQPYERWWGIEILDMTRSSIRDARLRNGLPICVDHVWADLVGKAEEFEITSDRKLRLLARFGRSARAEEIWQDVLDGIRTDTSVGYVIHDLVLERQEEGLSTYRVTDWEPLEGSLVAVPADPSVGVGRAHAESQPAPRNSTTRSNAMTPEEKAALEAQLRAKIEAEAREKAEAEARQRDAATQARAEVEAATKREQERVAALLSAGDAYPGGDKIARELIKDPAATVETFKARILDAQTGRDKPVATGQPADVKPAYGDGLRSRLRFAPLKAFKDQVVEGGNVMKAEEAAFRAGQWVAATIYGRESAAKWCRENGIAFGGNQVRVMSGNSLGAGGALIPVEMENAVIDLRDAYGVARKICRVRPMTSDSLNIPRRVSGVTAYFFNDDDGAGITASDKGWGNVQLTAKKLGALSRVSRDLIEDAVINVADDLAQEMGYAFAVKEDQCLIDGDGTSTYGGISGIRPAFVATAYASRITLATNHDLMSEVDATDLANVMAGIAAYAAPRAKWLCSRTFKAAVFDRLKATAGGNRVDTLGMGAGDEYLGYPIVTSEAMPSDSATDFTSLVMAMFGDFSLSTSVGSRRGIEVQVLQERYAELGQLGIVATERFDIVTHDLGSTTVKGPVAAAYGA